ncbi:MAG: response regulator [Candidatus Binatia bacterium]
MARRLRITAPRGRTAQRLAIIADDDEITRILLQRSLTLSGWIAIPVDDGGEIWPILEREDVTALVLDLNMPGVNGWEVLRKLRSDPVLREQRGHLRVVILSGQSDPGSREFALQLGADDFLAKPLDLDAVHRVLGRA